MNLRNLLAAAGVVGAVALAASAANATTATATASATIVTPASMSSTQSLAFGTIAKPTSGTQTVTVAAAAGSQTPTLSAGGNGYVATSGQAHAAIFHLSGTANSNYTLDHTSSKLVFSNDDGTLSPTVVFPSDSSLDGTGAADVPVGATITISPATTTTTYTGTLTLVATFQ
jgi:hypothetical protein